MNLSLTPAFHRAQPPLFPLRLTLPLSILPDPLIKRITKAILSHVLGLIPTPKAAIPLTLQAQISSPKDLIPPHFDLQLQINQSTAQLLLKTPDLSIQRETPSAKFAPGGDMQLGTVGAGMMLIWIRFRKPM